MAIVSTMCVCGENEVMADLGADNVFRPHTSRRTGEPCPGIPQIPYAPPPELTFGDAFAPLLSVWVPGRPKTKGSMRVVNGRRGVLTESVDGSKRWRQLVAYAMSSQMMKTSDWATLTGPAGLDLEFRMPVNPTGGRAGDIDKLARNVLDALTDAGLYADDVLVSSLRATKVGPVDEPGVLIKVWDLSDAG